MYSNMHTHTVFSDGKNTVEETVISAIKKGMVSIGISDHGYTYFDTSYCIQKDDVAKYIAEVNRVKREYADKIEVYLGVELDGLAYLDDRELYDYVIGDCHYIPTSHGYVAADLDKNSFLETLNVDYRGDQIALAKAYYELYVDCVTKVKPEILGHIDLITKYSVLDTSSKAYQDVAKEALRASLKVCPVIEMNTGAISRGYRKSPYPENFLLDEIRELGGKIILSSDSHSADSITCCFDECVELLKSRGFDSIVVFRGGRFVEQGI